MALGAVLAGTQIISAVKDIPIRGTAQVAGEAHGWLNWGEPCPAFGDDVALNRGGLLFQQSQVLACRVVVNPDQFRAAPALSALIPVRPSSSKPESLSEPGRLDRIIAFGDTPCPVVRYRYAIADIAYHTAKSADARALEHSIDVPAEWHNRFIFVAFWRITVWPFHMSTLSIKRSAFTPPLVGLLATVAVLVCFLAFGDALLELVSRWNKQEEYSHGYLIPLVSAWLLWMRRDALTANIGEPSYLGCVLILIAAALHITGELSAIWILSQVGFVIALMGIVLAIGGYSLLRIAFIPIAYLIFAIPLPYFIDATLTLKLQLLSSQLGVLFIRLFQIPVYLDGNVIDMGTYKLQVIEACSGLRYLYPLLSLSFLAAYLFHGALWQRAIIFLSAIPIAIGMNSFRIGLVGLLVDRWGTQMAEGALHFFEGWVIFLACSALLAGEMYLLALLSGRRFFDVFHLQNTWTGPVKQKPKTNSRTFPLIASLSLLCLGGAGVFLDFRTL